MNIKIDIFDCRGVNMIEKLMTGEQAIYKDVTFRIVDDQSSKCLQCIGTDVNSILEMYEVLKNNGVQVDTTKVFISSSKNKYDVDYRFLKSIPNVLIKYGMDWDVYTDLDSFLSYQEKINFYRNQLKDLSPLEKLVFGYDFSKSHSYKASSNASEHSLPHFTIDGEYMVCRGYSLLVDELLAGMDEHLSCADTGWEVCDCNGQVVDHHSIGIVKIHDDKYHLHGLYYFDPTADCYHPGNTAYFGDDYAPMDLYRYFLKPLNDPEIYDRKNLQYKFLFLGTDEELLQVDSHRPYVQDCNQEDKIVELLQMDRDEISIFLDEGLGNIFEEEDDITSYITTEQPQLSTILEAVYTVRLAMGYSEEMARQEVLRIEAENQEFFEEKNNCRH